MNIYFKHWLALTNNSIINIVSIYFADHLSVSGIDRARLKFFQGFWFLIIRGKQ